MSKQPNLFWCEQCGIYVSHNAIARHQNGEPHRCPSCGGTLEVADVKPPAPEFYCPNCQLDIRKADAIPADGLKPPSCSHCGTPLLLAAEMVANPIPTGFSLKLIGVVARLLIRSGALERLEQYAEKTSTPVDDFAARIAHALVKEAARL